MKIFSGTFKAYLKDSELQDRIHSLQQMYMPMDLNPEFKKSKKISIKKLDYILNHTNRKTLQDTDFSELVICSLTTLYFFGMRLKITRLTSKFWYWWGKRDFLNAEAAFQKTMDRLLPERNDIVIKITLNFFTNVSLWPYESFVRQILEIILYFNMGKMTLFNMMLTDTHYVLFSDVKSARHRMRVLYELLKSNNWIIDRQKLLPFITRLLDFFACSITKDSNKSRVYKYLRKGFEVCIQRILERVDNRQRLNIITTMLNWFAMVNMNDDDVLEFSLLLDRATELYKVETYNESFSDGLFNHVLRNLVGSSNAVHSLIGCRVLQRFLDRNNNIKYLVTPTLFYEFSQIRLVVGTYDSADKKFLRQYRDNINKYILMACEMHCHNTVNLKALFSVICLLVLEVPCGLTAAAAACFVMSIQDYALNGENLSATCRYWMHALVVSVMSLICWVHKAPVLYSYVNQIISQRAKEAPQLNPPLLPVYYVRHHHVTWNKPTLFFEDWELRYGLWKHFQDPEFARRGISKSLKKIPTLDMGF